MDPGHHTAFLLAILICILLLLLALSSLIMCYFRKYGFKMLDRKSSRQGRLVKNQATSMTHFAFSAMDPKFNLYKDSKNAPALSLPISVEHHSHKATTPTSLLFPDSHIVNLSGCDDEEESRTTELVSPSAQKMGGSSGGFRALRHVYSGASLFANVLGRKSMLSFKSKRRSSSPKHAGNADFLMVPLESPVAIPRTDVAPSHVVHSANVRRDRSCSSTILCDNSCDQQFTWNTMGLSVYSEHAGHKESFSVPTTLERKPCTHEEESIKQNNELPPPHQWQPKSWFIYMGNRPVSDGVKLETKDLNNVTSLDSGVDVLEAPRGNRGPKMQQRTCSVDQQHLLDEMANKGSERTNGGGKELDLSREECDNISHQEAARKLNAGNYSRSLWERREERPLIGVN